MSSTVNRPREIRLAKGNRRGEIRGRRNYVLYATGVWLKAVECMYGGEVRLPVGNTRSS